MATKNLDWETRLKLQKLDSKLNWRRIYVRDTFNSISNSIKNTYHDLNKPFAAGIAILFFAMASLLVYKESQKIPQTTCISTMAVDNQIESRYDDLTDRVAGRISVLGSKEQDQRLCLGLIAASNTGYAQELREKGFIGIVPLQPQEAGLEAAVLKNDPEQCLMSAMGLINQLRIQNENKLETRLDFENLITDFWYRTEQNNFKDMPRKGDWAYIVKAKDAYAHKMDSQISERNEKRLGHHRRALGVEEAIKRNPEQAEFRRRLYERNGTSQKITDPLEMFYVQAVIDAHKKYISWEGDYTWLDLIPEDKAKPVRIILAYLDGMDISSGKKKDK